MKKIILYSLLLINLVAMPMESEHDVERALPSNKTIKNALFRKALLEKLDGLTQAVKIFNETNKDETRSFRISMVLLSGFISGAILLATSFITSKLSAIAGQLD